MQHIGNLANAAQSAKLSECSTTLPRTCKPTIPAKWTAALFAKFAAIWGDKWAARLSSETDTALALREWGEALHGLTPEQIGAGIESARGSMEWPPSIAEFIRLAKGRSACFEHHGPAYRAHVRALPKPRNKTAALGHLSDIRQRLSTGTAKKQP